MITEQIPEQKYFLNDEDHEIESSCFHTERSGGNLSISVGGSDTQKAFGGSTPDEEIEHNTKTGSSRTDISIDVDYVESELICVDEVEDLDQIDDMYHDQTITIWDSDIYIGHGFDGKIPPDEIMEEWEHTTKAIRKMTLLHIAASRGTKDVVRLLLHHRACERPESATLAEPTALHLAALLGQSQVMKVLLDRTVNVDPRDINGFTPLRNAVWYGYDHVVNELLEHGADTNAKDGKGLTPLHVTADMGYDLLVKDSLDDGADPLIEDNDGDTPLQLAEIGGRDQVIKVFFNRH